jgi:hypothetical protein
MSRAVVIWMDGELRWKIAQAVLKIIGMDANDEGGPFSAARGAPLSLFEQSKERAPVYGLYIPFRPRTSRETKWIDSAAPDPEITARFFT